MSENGLSPLPTLDIPDESRASSRASSSRHSSRASSRNPSPARKLRKERSRFGLQLEAQAWRGLMGVGMLLHRVPFGPNTYSYRFTQTIPSTISPQKGSIDLLFYTPKEYQRPNNKHSKQDACILQRYPTVVNFHGGGFTIGAAHDDSRWADAVTNHVGAVVVSVEYRLAPEYPFPTAVEDGADAVLYLIDHAEELGIDPERIAISGFSAGGNMAFTVPLMLQAEFRRRHGSYSAGKIVDEDTPIMAYGGKAKKGVIQGILAWYPPTDYATHSREERRATNVRQDKSLPTFFTDLFDASYLSTATGPVDLNSPYLSPGLAPDDMLKALPEDIVMYICEWDELRAEGERFAERLRTLPGAKKRVKTKVVEGVAHAFDKNPNPLWRDQSVEDLYAEACVLLKLALNGEDVEEEIDVRVESENTRSRIKPDID